MRGLLRGLLDLVLPPACAGCGCGVTPPQVLCAACAVRLPRLPRDACVRCQAAPAGPGGLRCVACASRSGGLGACVAEVAFAGEAAAWVRRFKYGRPGLAGLDPRPAAVVGWLAAEAARRLPPPGPTLLVPVPIHPRRLRARGFHPAGELCRVLARACGLPWDPTLIGRRRDTPSQTGLDRRARERNVAGAFRARRRLAGRACVGLVDDVVTTGATLAAAARALERAGAGRVVAVCVARTPGGP